MNPTPHLAAVFAAALLAAGCVPEGSDARKAPPTSDNTHTLEPHQPTAEARYEAPPAPAGAEAGAAAAGPTETHTPERGQATAAAGVERHPADAPHRIDLEEARPTAGAAANAIADIATAKRERSLASEAAAAPGPALQGQLLGSDAITWPVAPPPYASGEQYAQVPVVGFQAVESAPLSTFSLDVDTGAWSNVRRFLEDGRLPPPAAVRIEEMVNWFSYDYPAPAAGEVFSLTHDMAPAPWNPAHRILAVGLRSRSPADTTTLPANLVLLVDVSGSMASADKLPLLKSALRLLVADLSPQDRVGIVTYAGSAGVALPSTPVHERERILAAIDALSAGGSTAGEGGIDLAYRVARDGFIAGGVNRVLLATDGDFNVGTRDVPSLEAMVSQRRASGIGLSTLGFGTGNYNDHLMERLADCGNGSHAYIDSLAEGHRVLVRNRSSLLDIVAADAKVQVEFNPARVASWRLIGYDNRRLADADFHDDRVDAGEVGAGHTVTALYEIVPRTGAAAQGPGLDREVGFLRLRYREPDAAQAEERHWPLIVRPELRFEDSSANLRFAASVVGFGEFLRGGAFASGWSLPAIRQTALGSLGADPEGERHGFVALVDLAAALAPERATTHHAAPEPVAPTLRYPRLPEADEWTRP